MFFNLLNSIAMNFNRILAPIAHNLMFLLNTGDNLSDKDGLLDEGAIKNFGQLASGVERIMKDIVGPIMIVIGALLVIFMIKIGVDYAKAEDANKRKEKMGHLIGIGVGIVIIIVGITLCYAINWVELYATATGHRHAMKDTNDDGFCDYCAQNGNSVIHK